MSRLLVSVFLLVFCAASATLAQPNHVSYQGELVKDGVPFNGTASFKFAIVSGTATLWSNDGTSTNGSEPAAAVSLNVDKGIFSVLLGDARSRMVPLTADLLAGSRNAVLRVWVSTDDKASFEQLSDQRLSSGVFALQSSSADRLRPPGRGRTADGDWTVSDENVFSAVSGNVGIGTSTPEHKLHVIGSTNISNVGDGASLLRLDLERAWEFRQLGIGPGASLELANIEGGNNNLIISTLGAVGIGTNSSDGKLVVAGTIHSTSGGIKFPDGSLQTTAVSGTLMLPFSGTATRGTAFEITSTGREAIRGTAEDVAIVGVATGIGGVGVVGNGKIGVNGTSSDPTGYGGSFRNFAVDGTALWAQGAGSRGQAALFEGDVTVTQNLEVGGAYVGNFPRPAYDSGNVSINPGQAIELTHNLGGNPEDYVVDMQGSSAGFGTTNFKMGQTDGIFYSDLNNRRIVVTNNEDDFLPVIGFVRIRIWVYQ